MRRLPCRRLLVVGFCSVFFLHPLLSVGRADEELGLEEAIRLAFLKNERVGIAEGLLAAAEARVAKARSFFFPDLTLSGRYGRRNDSGTISVGGQTFSGSDPTVSQGTASITLSLFDARAFPLYRQAGLDRHAAGLSRAEEKRLLAFDVANAFLQTLGTEQVEASAGRRLTFARRTVEDTKSRFGAKLVGLNDVTRAELELATAEREATVARGEAQLFRLQLGYLIGSNIDRPLAVPEDLLSPPEVRAPEEIIGEALSRRLDLAADKARVEALRAFAEEPARRVIPILGLNGQVQQDFAAGADERDWFIGLNLTWFLYDGGERRADRSERTALANVADLRLSAAKRKVDLEVRNALIALENDRAATQQARVAAEIGRKNAEEVTVLYGQGLATALEVADASVRLFEAEVALARARFGLGLSLLGLYAARGLDPLGSEVIP